MKIKTALVLFALIFTYSVFSQSAGKISGTVVDKSTKLPLEAADVTLLTAKDSAVVKGLSTDKEGKFSFTDIPFGQYSVRISFVGYNIVSVKGISLTQEKSEVTIETVSLSSGSTTTEEILVETQKSPIQFDGDKKVFNVSQNPMSQSGSAIELLKNIPSVSIDADGNVSLRGNSNVKITVDGRPFGMEGQNRSQLLEQLPANSIESIELVTNPSSKYEAEGVSGIINIVTKKTKTFGYNGNLSLNAGTGDKYGGSFNINLKNEKVQIFSNYNYNLINFKLTGESDRTNSLSTSEYLLTQNNTGNGRVKSHFVKGGLDYFINPQNTLGLSVSYQNSARKRGELITSKNYDPANNLTSHFTRDYNADVKNNTLDLALNHSFKFKNPKQTLTTDVIYSQNNNTENSFITGHDIMPQSANDELINETSSVKDKDFSVQSDYIHPFSEESKLETGFKSRYRKKQNDYVNQYFDYNTNQYVTDLNLTNNFEYNDLVNAVYAQYSSKAGIFSYMLGTRVEQTNTKSRLLTNNSEFKRDYVDFFPSANVSAQISKSNEVQLSYSRRIRRPGMWELNPFVNTADPNNYFSGNPDLKPEYTDSYELSFIQYLPATSLTPTLFYRHTKDMISRTREYIDSNTTLTSMVNYAKSDSYGMEFIFNSQPVSFWNINGSVSYFKTEVDATNISSTFTNEGSTWSGRVSSSLFLPAQFSLQLSYFYSGDIIAAQATIEPFHSFDAALKKDFFDGKLTATLRASDIFNTLRFRVNINNDANFREILERKRDTRTINFSLNFKFGEADKTPPKRRRDNNRENQGNDGLGF